MSVYEFTKLSAKIAEYAVAWRKITHRTYDEKRSYVIAVSDMLYCTIQYTGLQINQIDSIAEGIADQFEVTL